MRNIILAAVLTMASLAATGAQTHGIHAVAQADSVLHTNPHREIDGLIHRHMVQSAHPVTVSMRGNAVCVRSKHSQLLPVYTQNGIFYAAFRLTKGTNWLSGLPRGTYIINNKRVTIT